MKDICIVGFGLAGLSAARHAEKQGLTFDIISDYSQQSSRVAGGLLNPVSVKRMKPVWQVEKFLDYAKAYYSDWKNDLDIPCYKNIPIQVIIHNTTQENNWYEACDHPRLKPYIYKNLFEDRHSNLKGKKYGLIKAGLVDLSTLLPGAQRYYENKGFWNNETFDHGQLYLNSDAVEYKNQKYKHVIFCEGYGIIDNPYFNNLGIYGNKGDYLIFESKQLQMSNVVKAKYFLIPLGNYLYKFGATYQRQPLNHKPSEEAKAQMLEALDKMIKCNYAIVNQVCGIRPTTKDRHPVAGTHSKHRQLHILNGFGSRGVMMSPTLGKLLINHIFKAEPIDKEMSIQRIYAQI